MERFIRVRGKQLFLDIRGPDDAPALLYIHGGPGQGSHEFMAFQGDRLSDRLRVIGLDQRGVLRSDPLEEGEPFRLSDLVDDCETVRKLLGIVRWSILGQSFGGYIALLYAVTYPEAVARLLFENPTWDLGQTARSVLQKASGIFKASGDATAASRCLAVADGDLSTRSIWAGLLEVLGELGPKRLNLYFHQPWAADRFAQTESTATFPPEWRRRGVVHHRCVFEDDQIWESVIPRFSEVQCPSLLVKGVHDAIPSETEVEAYLRLCPKARIERFEKSAHFVQLEEPERYAEVVTAFVMGRD